MKQEDHDGPESLTRDDGPESLTRDDLVTID